MNIYDATESAYQNGFESGFEEGRSGVVRHGKWIEIEENSNGHLNECSVCGNWVFHNYEYVSKYCPECGSKMDLAE